MPSSLPPQGLHASDTQTELRKSFRKATACLPLARVRLPLNAAPIVRQMLDFLNDTATKQATDAERAFLGLLEGGCQVPIGVHAEVNEGRIAMEAVIASLDGSTVLRDTAEGNAADAVTLGRTLGQKMLDNGGREILAAIL